MEEIIELAAALGFDGLMLAAKRPHASLLDMNAGARCGVRAKLEGAG